MTCQADKEKKIELSLFTIKTQLKREKKTENYSTAMTHPLNFLYVPLMHEIKHIWYILAPCPWKQSNKKTVALSGVIAVLKSCGRKGEEKVGSAAGGLS